MTEEMELRRRNMSELLEGLQGRILFSKEVLPTNVPVLSTQADQRAPTCNGLTVPRSFVKAHGNKFRKSVVLLTNSKTWTLRLSITRCPLSPVVVFCKGWKEFALFNSLMEGDQLVFLLSAMSQFHVYVFDANGFPKAVTPPTEAPPMNCPSEEFENKPKVEVLESLMAPPTEAPSMNWSEEFENKPKAEVLESLVAPPTEAPLMNWSEVSQLIPKGEDMKSSKCKHEHEHEHDSVDEFWGLFAKKTEEPEEQDMEKDANEHMNYAPHKKQKLLPRFPKRLSQINVCSCGGKSAALEIPGEFVRTYSSQLRTLVKLQGIHEGSPVRTVTCSWKKSRDSLRLFFNHGWKAFVHENGLEEGQELDFTLTSDSLFVVRKS